MEICFSTKNFPAPNHYDLFKGVFDKRKYIPCKCDTLTVEPPFNQTAKVRFYTYLSSTVTRTIMAYSSFKRFEENFQLDTPGPGTYEIAGPQICYSSILNAPFGAFDDRFKRILDVVTPGTSCYVTKFFTRYAHRIQICIKTAYICTAGPADYHTVIGTLAFESARRFKNKHGTMFDYLKFYKTLVSLLSANDEYVEIDKYKVGKKADGGKRLVYHAVFKSKVDRFPKIRKDVSIIRNFVCIM